MKIALLCNKNAARGRSGIDRIAKDAHRRGIPVAYTDDLHELAPALTHLLESSPDIICFAGGDGTLSHGVNTLMRLMRSDSMPIVCPIGGGTMNVVARWLGWRRKPRVNWERVLRTDVPHVVTRRLLEIHDSARSAPEFAFIFSAGILPMLIERYIARDPTWWRGLSLFMESWIRGALGHAFRSPRITLSMSGSTTTARYPIILASVVPQIIFDIEPYPEPPSEDCFSLLAIRASFTAIARRLPLLLWGRVPLHDSRYTGKAVRECRLSMTAPYVVDGELIPRIGRRHEIAIRLGNPIRLLQSP